MWMSMQTAAWNTAHEPTLLHVNDATNTNSITATIQGDSTDPDYQKVILYLNGTQVASSVAQLTGMPLVLVHGSTLLSRNVKSLWVCIVMKSLSVVISKSVIRALLTLLLMMLLLWSFQSSNCKQFFPW